MRTSPPTPFVAYFATFSRQRVHYITLAFFWLQDETPAACRYLDESFYFFFFSPPLRCPPAMLRRRVAFHADADMLFSPCSLIAYFSAL